MLKNENHYHALALFSGGLDSILAAKVIQNQGLKVKCLHYTSPFFGFPEKIEHWKKIYGLDIEAIDISEDYAKLLQTLPVYGFGSTLNPCVDCKILMMRKTKELLEKYQAQCIVSGEVIGQRPMSQRRDTLNVIRRDAGIKDILLRPLCAKHLDPTTVENEGLVDREKLYSFSGRGRVEQLALAKELNITEIPTPAGGCKLTEQDTSARYWQVLNLHNPTAENFHLSNIGRQFWHEEELGTWLIIGRNQEDNQKLENLKQEGDFLFRVNGFPSPLALARPCKKTFSDKILQDMSKFVASYSPKAVKFSEGFKEVEVFITEIIQNMNAENSTFNKESAIKIIPNRASFFKEPDWKKSQIAIKEKFKVQKN